MTVEFQECYFEEQESGGGGATHPQRPCSLSLLLIVDGARPFQRGGAGWGVTLASFSSYL